MFRRNNLRMPHRVDILLPERTNAPSGQKKADWYLISEKAKCYYVPHRAIIRVTPTAEETEKLMFFFSSDAGINYKSRLENLTDRNGRPIPHLEHKKFEIVAINHFTNYAGKPHHMQVIAETVIE